ncbi:DUF726 domain-containing protein [Dietzia sp. CH92]|uniref:DUF726 domain-containing protein n=1 Tax=Dietzia sp. CH92 TaxID=3051823 RepID=UPI0028D7FBF9|nr:DUF726 domain-containing protein [Dietzia sp. CH92]
MPGEAVWFRKSDDGSTVAEARSAKGLKLTLTGMPGDLEPQAVGDDRLKRNATLCHNLWAYGGFERQLADLPDLVDDPDASNIQDAADAAADLASGVGLPAVIPDSDVPLDQDDDELPPDPELVDVPELVGRKARAALQKKADGHARVVKKMVVLIDELGEETHEGWCSNCFNKSVHRKVASARLRSNTYLCEDCGAPTDKCAAPRCTNMANRSLGTLHLPGFCAEHSHDLPSFERANDQIERLDDIKTFLKYDKPNLARGTQLGLTAVFTAGAAFPLALAAAPAVGGVVGVLASKFGAGATLAGAAAVNHGLAILGFGTIAAGGLGMAGGTMVVSAVGAALGGGLGASVTNSYVRGDKSFKIEFLREGNGVPVIIARGFTTEKSIDWWQAVDFVEKTYPGHPIYLLNWGSKELADVAILMGKVGAGQVGKTAVGGFAKRAGKKAAAKLNPILPVAIAADVAKNPWHVARVRADKTGVILADILARYDNEVILVGHSLGGRVMATAAQAASTNLRKSRIRDIRLAGAAIGATFDWDAVGRAASGVVVNYFSKNDSVLKTLYRAAEFGSIAAGLAGTGSAASNVHDVDVSDKVPNHSAYWLNIAGAF